MRLTDAMAGLHGVLSACVPLPETWAGDRARGDRARRYWTGASGKTPCESCRIPREHADRSVIDNALRGGKAEKRLNMRCCQVFHPG